MAIIYANNNELKALDDRVSALPDPVPPTPAADYYRHKVTVSGELNGHFYYTSTSNATVSSATTVSDWYNNTYKSGTSISGAFEGEAQGSDHYFSVRKVICGENPETGASTGGLIVSYTGDEGRILIFGFESVTTDEIIDL